MVILAVLLAHLALIMLVDFDTRSIRKADKARITYLIFIKEKVERSSAVLKKYNGVKQVRRAVVVPDVKPDISAAASSASSVPEKIDWDAKASAIAKEAARKFGSTPFRRFERQDPCDESDPLNSFKRECKKRDPDFSWNPEAPRIGFGKRPPPNGHLFDNLKPKYLRRPVEDICSKTMAGCNHSSSSSTR